MNSFKRSTSIFLILLLMSLGLMTACERVEEYKPDEKIIPNKLTVGILDNNIDAICVILAKELGYFEAEKLDVKFKTIETIIEGTTLLSNNELDILPYDIQCSSTSTLKDSNISVQAVKYKWDALVKFEIANLIYQNAETPLINSYLTQLKEEDKVSIDDAANPDKAIVHAEDIEVQIYKKALEEMAKRYPYVILLLLIHLNLFLHILQEY